MERTLASVHITPKGERALRGGHPWVYDAEVTDITGAPADGDVVDIFTGKDRWLGAGFYNSRSKIRVRCFSRNANDRFDESFWRRALAYAVDYRAAVLDAADFRCCRLIFGEADRFPGLTVDRFEDILVTETLSLGMERIKPMLFPALIDILRERGVAVRAVYERNESALREKEGMARGKGFFCGEGDGHVEICENGIFYDVDYISGQKTGFFLDQKFNRRAIRQIASGRRVLDCFTHTGAFGLNAAAGGAKHVTSVDVSADALAQAGRNAVRNGLEGKIDFLCADVFDLLTELGGKGGRGQYDFIILDPPAFTKSGATVKSAFRGYKEINRRAMQLLPRGGFLATCSCSHFMTDALFRDMLRQAASDAAVDLRQIEARQQGPDHPILWNVPETDYLKFYIFQVV
ncbi:MAG: class I SAM-dependent rRNA methyltransferase [Ruminococcaceae bacterium]|nr:class I SAM-dependent rRNA methyltransferase [Oscillospiraceae bacterium]